MKNKFWLFGTGFILAAALIGLTQEKKLKRQEMIKFSHQYHLEEIGVECTDCHLQVPESTTADDNLIPTMDNCAECHDIEDDENCTQCHFEDEDTWQPFELAPASVLFNHKLHLAQEGVTCEKCHQNLRKVDYSTAGSKPNMIVCAECHNNQTATLECVNCHSNTLNLRPVNHTADFLMIHKQLARIDQEECVVCHTDNDCSECHQGATLLSLVSGNEVNVQSPFNLTAWGTKGLILRRVHETNFRFTHPLQAQGRTTECAVCHEARSFCQECHDSEGVDVAGRPVWHGGADWGALAGVVGTGGGRHAELAKRDIENCTACHDTQGEDPTCLLCHTDFDGVQGTNPKTHESGYRNQFSVDSSFHEDANALCYACHVNTQVAGDRFCGYCHGTKN
ncbi:MAG: cytochrome c3 family protein [bacterium]